MDLFKCSHCGANLIEHGIREVLVGAKAETPISFEKKGTEKEVVFGTVDTSDFDNQWVVCALCDKEMHDRTAIEIIEAFRDGLSPIRKECGECGKSFGENVCDGCGLRASQCTGIREDKELCQQCCAEDFKHTTLTNPVAFLMVEAT
ncbi:MAG: hypothetical protein WCE94_03165 [Candidatus Methanoperedens sp.]